MLLKENSLSGTIRGLSVASKKQPSMGLRSIFPKFLRGIGQNHLHKKKNNNDHALVLLKKQNIQPETHHIQQLKLNQPIKRISAIQKSQKATVKVLPRGLHNIGNTCYMNSTLQCLFHLKYFISALIQQIDKRQSDSKISVANQIGLAIKQMQNKGSSLNLGNLKRNMGKKKPIFLGNAQQDGQQYLTNLLQILNQQLSRISKKSQYKELQGDPAKKSISQLSNEWWDYFQQIDNSIICDFFQGQTISTIKCRKCHKISVNFDNIWGMPISFHRHSSVFELLMNTWKGQSIVQGYFCTHCQLSRDCIKSVQLFRFPKILVIQLKRFLYEYGQKKKRKQEVKIDYEIDLKSILNQNARKNQQSKYRLKGVVHHQGEAQYGHYYAEVYCDALDQWFVLNDSIAQQTNLNLTSRSAYLLFYEQIN